MLYKSFFAYNSYLQTFFGYEVRGVFLDISKAFGKTWRDCIILKLEQNGISEKLHNLLHDFLVNRKLRVVLNGQVFSWTNVRQVLLKVQYSAHCSFLSISVTYQKVSHQTLNYLLTIHYCFRNP